MNVNTTSTWIFEEEKGEIHRIATEIVVDRAASIEIMETVWKCAEGQEPLPIDRIITLETEKYIKCILTNAFLTQNNIEKKDRSELKKELYNYVRESIPKLPLNTTISEILVNLARAESYDPFEVPELNTTDELSQESKQDSSDVQFLKLEQELSFLTTNVITELLTPEIKESLKTIIPTACRDYLRSLLLRLNPLIRLGNATDPDSPAPLVKQVAWEYIGQTKDKNSLAEDNLFPQPLAGRDPADTQQMVVYLLSQLNFIERQSVLLSRFCGNGITDRDIARHIGISVEELEDIQRDAFSKMAENDTSEIQEDTSQSQDTSETENFVYVSEDDFLAHYEDTWSKPVRNFAAVMFGHPVYVSKIVNTVMQKANCFRTANKFDPDNAWQGEDKWIGLRQLTAKACRDFIIQLDKAPVAHTASSLWGKCLETLNFNEYRSLMLSTFFYQRDEGIRDIADILNQSDNDVKTDIQSALQKVVKKSRQLAIM